MVLFVGFKLFKILLLLVIVVVDICYWLHPVVSPGIRQGVTVMKSKKIKLECKGILVLCLCPDI